MTAAAAAALSRRVRNDAALTRPGDPHRESVAASPALGDEIRQQPGMVCGIRLHSNRPGDLAFYIQTPSRRVPISGRQQRPASRAGAAAASHEKRAPRPMLRTRLLRTDKERSARRLLLGKEQSWRTAWRTRSLLSRTNPSSGSDSSSASGGLLLARSETRLSLRPECSWRARLSIAAPLRRVRTRSRMSRSKAFGNRSETNQPPRNGPVRAAADLSDSLRRNEHSPGDAEHWWGDAQANHLRANCEAV
jgi:hypothetical protein